MTAPVIAEVRRRVPLLRLTIQTTIDPGFLASRYEDYGLVPEIADFGLLMNSSTEVDVDASARAYGRLVGEFDTLVERNRALLRADPPDLVVSNVAFIPLEAAHGEGIPSLALSSLNWADMCAHYFSDRPEGAEILSILRKAYGRAASFLRCLPAQEMTLPNCRDIGPVGRKVQGDRPGLRRRLGLAPDARVGLIAFGGIDHPLPLERWPSLPGWTWLNGLARTCERADMAAWRPLGMEFSHILASADVVITKPGYGTFSEAAMAGVPVLHVSRPGWPECPHLENWLSNHTRSLEVREEQLFTPALDNCLRTLFSLPEQQVADPTGVGEAADEIVARLFRR